MSEDITKERFKKIKELQMKENERHLLWGSRWIYSWWKPSIDKNLHKLNFPCSFLVIENQRTHTIRSDMLRKVFSPFKAYCPFCPKCP